MEKDLSTVILVIGFIRPENTSRILDVCLNKSNLPVIVSLDGPRNDYDSALIKEINEKVLSYNKSNRIVLKKSDRNLGLSAHITQAIDFSLITYESVIVLEDDCIPSDTFFTFCINGLNHYKGREDIIYLSGSNLDVDLPLKGGEDCVLTHYGQIWGWATWRKRWLNRKQKVNFRTILSAPIPWSEKIFWMRNFRKPLWDSIWGFYNLVAQNGYALMPRFNLVENIGFDSKATNYGEDSSRNLMYSLHNEEVDVTKCSKYSSEVDRKIFNLRYRGL